MMRIITTMKNYNDAVRKMYIALNIKNCYSNSLSIPFDDARIMKNIRNHTHYISQNRTIQIQAISKNIVAILAFIRISSKIKIVLTMPTTLLSMNHGHKNQDGNI
jgi:hypothetical protein